MTVYKSNDDIPSRMSIPLPFVIMRENATKERFAEYYKKDNLHGWLFCALVVMGQLFVLGLLLSLGNSILDIIWFWLLLIVMFAVISMIDKYQYKKQLKVIKNLPKITPFIAINHQDVRVYDPFGEELVAMPIDKIGSVYILSKGNLSFAISYKKSLWHDFSYVISSNEMGAIFYFTHQNERYIPENLRSCIWIIDSMVKMLQQDPTASHFPFVKKNYTNGRAWDDP